MLLPTCKREQAPLPLGAAHGQKSIESTITCSTQFVVKGSPPGHTSASGCLPQARVYGNTPRNHSAWALLVAHQEKAQGGSWGRPFSLAISRCPPEYERIKSPLNVPREDSLFHSVVPNIGSCDFFFCRFSAFYFSTLKIILIFNIKNYFPPISISVSFSCPANKLGVRWSQVFQHSQPCQKCYCMNILKATALTQINSSEYPHTRHSPGSKILTALPSFCQKQV